MIEVIQWIVKINCIFTLGWSLTRDKQKQQKEQKQTNKSLYREVVGIHQSVGDDRPWIRAPGKCQVWLQLVLAEQHLL